MTSTAHTAFRKYLLLGVLCAGVEKDARTCEPHSEGIHLTRNSVRRALRKARLESSPTPPPVSFITWGVSKPLSPCYPSIFTFSRGS